MSLNFSPQTFTAAQYAEIFAREQALVYPAIAAFEDRYGYAVDRERLETSARVLNCPFKALPPNWQHGRVIYTMVRRRLASISEGPVLLVDIGTAKGFSALALEWARADAGIPGLVVSCDVMGPALRVRRNTPAEIGGLRTLAELLDPWPEAASIRFIESTGIDLLKASSDRIHVAFVDGKHTTDVVAAEWRLLSKRQQSGDVAIFDDVQMPQVRSGLLGAEKAYQFEDLALGVINRAYAIGVRR